jgi:hypothetical protein
VALALFEELHKGMVYLFPHMHTHKTETKKTIKIRNPKNSIEKIKRRQKRNPTRKNRHK